MLLMVFNDWFILKTGFKVTQTSKPAFSSYLNILLLSFYCGNSGKHFAFNCFKKCTATG